MDNDGHSAWAPYLKHPLVLVGYVIMLFTFVVTAIIKSKAITNELLSHALQYLFILSILVVVLGFILAFRKTRRKNSSVNLTYGSTSKDEEQREGTKGREKK